MRDLARSLRILTLCLLGAATLHDTWAGLLSKRYEFKSGVILEVGAQSEDGLRLDTVEFQVPTPIGGMVTRSGGLVTVDVAISNTAQEARRVGIAVALFDDAGRLLGVANGGNKLMSVKPGRQARFELSFDGVNAEAHRATVFHVSVEMKP
jgi:hypothetical protein